MGLAVYVLHITTMPGLSMNKITNLKCCPLLPFVVALALAGLSGCNKSDTPAQAQAPDSTVVADSDPAAGNLAPVSGVPVSTPVSTEPQQVAQNVAQNNAPDYN